jgi:PAS domain S-box-containing protein
MKTEPVAILIVEDERIIARDLEQTLAQLGYTPCGIASSADSALSMTAERRPDLVLMDIRIQGSRDGIDTAQDLQSQFDIPVVYLTAHADETTLARAKQTGPYGYLLKPVKLAELRSVVEVSIYKHRLERDVRARERWLSTILNSIGDAIVAVDPAGRLIFMNPIAETLTGLRFEEVRERPSREVLVLEDADGEPLDPTPLECALRAEGPATDTEPLSADLRLRTRARTITITGSVSRVTDGNRVLGAVMVFRDVTAQREVERRLRESERLTALGTMAAGVAHEVSNPLAVVMTNAGIVEEDLRLQTDGGGTGAGTGARDRPGATLDALTDLQSAARRIGRIVQDLRDYSRPAIQAHGDADVAHAVDWAVRATAREFTYRARLVTEIPALPRVAADEVRLGQLLVNLLVNAAHAIAPGNHDHQLVRVTAELDPGGDVLLRVADTGCGIAEWELATIFEPFHTSKPAGIGMGLGLSICKGIVTAFGGSIDVSSTVGVGSTFTVRLPAVKAAPQVAASVDDLVPRVLNARILVIDDDPLVLSAFRRALAGYEVVTTEHARDALDWLANGQRFDLIVCDLVMPNMSGMEFHGSLLLLQPQDAARILFVTGGAITAEVREFLDAVPNPRIDKPCDAATLRSIVHEMLTRGRPQPARPEQRDGNERQDGAAAPPDRRRR